MQTSEKTTEISKALLKAQAEFQPVFKEKVAKVRHKNGGQHIYTYADLACVIEACLEKLQQNGILMQQETTVEGSIVNFSTRFTHVETGEWQEFNGLKIDAGTNAAQAVGSAITYGRRYQLITAIGIAQEDDDGKSAQQSYVRNQEQPPAQNKPTQSQAATENPSQVETPGQKLKKVLHEHCGCQSPEQALLLLNWACMDAFAELPPVFAKPELAQSVLDRLKTIHESEGVKLSQMLHTAQQDAQQEHADTFPK